MAEKEVPRKVYVDVSTNVIIGPFGQKVQQRTPENSGYYISVKLSESELRLTGELFVAAVRRALTRSLASDQEQEQDRDRKVLVCKKGPVTPSSDSQVFGFMIDLKTIKITDQWNEPA